MTTLLGSPPQNVAIVFDGADVVNTLVGRGPTLRIDEQTAELVPVKIGTPGGDTPNEKLKSIAKQLEQLGDGSVPDEPESLPEEEYRQYQRLKEQFVFYRDLRDSPGRDTTPRPPFEELPAIQLLYTERPPSQICGAVRVRGFRGRTYDDPRTPMMDGERVDVKTLTAEIDRLCADHEIDLILVASFHRRDDDDGVPLINAELADEIDPQGSGELEQAINQRVPNSESGTSGGDVI